MGNEEQDALLGMWAEYLGDRPPSAPLMRAFYLDVVYFSPHYRYGMAPELFDLLVNGPFQPAEAGLWAAAHRRPGHQAA